MSERTDEQLLHDYLSGESGVLRTLIERHQLDLMRFLTRLMGDRDAAEDVFQETFLQVHLSGHTFDPSRRFKPWLFTIAANKGRDQLRRRARRQTLDLSTPVGGGSNDSGGAELVDLMEIDIPAPDAALLDRERDEQVQRAIARLAPSLREIVLLAYFQRLTYTQIADELGIPLGTVKSRLHAGVAAFARAWQLEQQRRIGAKGKGSA